MDPRQRVPAVLNHQPPDRVPRMINFYPVTFPQLGSQDPGDYFHTEIRFVELADPVDQDDFLRYLRRPASGSATFPPCAPTSPGNTTQRPRGPTA